MKILLFGEFSGFMNCLKDGLIALGHQVFLASNGDGFRDYPSDFRWDSHLTKHYNRWFIPYYVGNIYMHKKYLRGYDVVLLMGPNLISSRLLCINNPVYDYIIKNNERVFLSGAGLNAVSFDYWYNSNTKYRQYCEGILIDNPNFVLNNNSKIKKWESSLFDKIDGYIPIWYEYAEPYRNNEKLLSTIRIPINVHRFQYKPNKVKDHKVVFYHGVHRESKGTRFIKPAFDKMSKLYPKEVEFICAEHLPFNEYMKVIENANVIVDDANSFSIAMNGLFSLAKGKLIMGGAEPIANKELGLKYNPVFNINPDVDQICSVIEDIIQKKDEIEEIGFKGRQFVEEYHDYIDIAKQYITLFEKELNK